jgi:hypothetical protein
LGATAFLGPIQMPKSAYLQSPVVPSGKPSHILAMYSVLLECNGAPSLPPNTTTAPPRWPMPTQ